MYAVTLVTRPPSAPSSSSSPFLPSRNLVLPVTHLLPYYTRETLDDDTPRFLWRSTSTIPPSPFTKILSPLVDRCPCLRPQKTYPHIRRSHPDLLSGIRLSHHYTNLRFSESEHPHQSLYLFTSRGSEHFLFPRTGVLFPNTNSVLNLLDQRYKTSPINKVRSRMTHVKIKRSHCQ